MSNAIDRLLIYATAPMGDSVKWSEGISHNPVVAEPIRATLSKFNGSNLAVARVSFDSKLSEHGGGGNAIPTPTAFQALAVCVAAALPYSSVAARMDAVLASAYLEVDTRYTVLVL